MLVLQIMNKDKNKKKEKLYCSSFFYFNKYMKGYFTGILSILF